MVFGIVRLGMKHLASALYIVWYKAIFSGHHSYQHLTYQLAIFSDPINLAVHKSLWSPPDPSDRRGVLFER